jgi:hypothetical protein
MHLFSRHFIGAAVLALGAWLPGPAPAAAPGNTGFAVTTHHYDNLRTGWNQQETTLTPGTVSSGSFGLQAQVAVDEQVDAQPLFVPNQIINGQGPYDVVYVATENNSIYAIDANSGNILAQQNYGAAVPYTVLPGQCLNSSANLGINSTPVIDLPSNTIYAITYTLENHEPTFRIHSINASTLKDQITPAPLVTGQSNLKNGQVLDFDSRNNRQRSALIETSGNIYAGFASWCDINANVSRGWVLGWNTGSLAPIGASELTNKLTHDGDNFFLSSIWMSGAGITSDDQGNLFFITGNTDYDSKAYNQTYNIAESVVKLSTDLTTVEDHFTPTGNQVGWKVLDEYDLDFGAAGILLLPDQSGAYPHLAYAGGKYGPMYLLNRDNLGGTGKPKITLGTYNNYGCWCTQSYYVGGDGVGRIVQSTGDSLDIWQLQTGNKKPYLTYDTGNSVNGSQDPGFFTTISSNGTQQGSHVIWAVERPSNFTTNAVVLDAFDPANSANLLFSSPNTTAGTWPFDCCANANLVPVVANGHVFVGSYQNLSIFGLASGGKKPIAQGRPAPPVTFALPAGVKHEVFGTVTAIEGDSFTLRTRTGQDLKVDASAAKAASAYAPVAIGHASLVRGDYQRGTLVAKYVLHAKPHAEFWPKDQ